jgi:hypothetical protein
MSSLSYECATRGAGAAVAAMEMFAFTQTRGLIAAPLDPASLSLCSASQTADDAVCRRLAARRCRAEASLRSRLAKIACWRPASLGAEDVVNDVVVAGVGIRFVGGRGGAMG